MASWASQPRGQAGRPYRRGIPFWGWILLSICGLAIALTCWGGWWIFGRVRHLRQVASTLPARLTQARAAGVPLSPADLVRQPPLPDKDNAAPLYVQMDREVRAVAKDPAGDEAVLHTMTGSFTPPERQAAERRIAQYQHPLQLAAQAAPRPDCDFHRDFNQGPYLLFPELASSRQIARLLAAQAVLQARDGHPEEALHTIEIGARMARHIGQDPIIISMLVRIALNAILDRAFRAIVFQYADRPQVLAHAAVCESAFGNAPDLLHAIRAESVVGMTVVEGIRDGRRWPDENGGNAVQFPRAAGVPIGVLVDAWEARMLAYWTRVYAGIRAAHGDQLIAYRVLLDAGKREEQAARSGDPSYLMDSILMPVYADAARTVIRDEAGRRLRREMLALLLYRDRTGRFPATLSEVGSPQPLDPFTDQPLHYRATPAGFVLYSVGENFRDDGGNDKPAQKGGKPPDIVIRYPA